MAFTMPTLLAIKYGIFFMLHSVLSGLVNVLLDIRSGLEGKHFEKHCFRIEYSHSVIYE